MKLTITLQVVSLANFVSIVNYNRSYFYAQSVAEFAEALGYNNKSVFPVQDQSTSKPVKEQQKPKKKEKKVKKVKKPKKSENWNYAGKTPVDR